MFENWRERKLKKWRWIRAAAWFWHTRYFPPLSMCVPSFNLLGLTVPENSATKKFKVWKLVRKKNQEINGWICSGSLIPVQDIHLPTVYVYTKFQSSRPHSSWEKCHEKFQCLKIGEKEKWRNRGMNKQQKPDSGIHHTSAHCPCVYQVSIF